MEGVKKENIGIGYKVFDSNWKCRGMQYEIGKEYHFDGDIELCKIGFHFCPNLIDCFNYYSWDSSNKVAIIHYDLTKSIMPNDSDKYVTSHIRIVKEIEWGDVMRMCNIGIFNTGHRNTGDRNTGDRNTGNRNTGEWNTGNRNTGHSNTGNSNTGDSNTGDWDTGDWNTGDWNTGHWNTGHSNTGNRNTGHSNTGHSNTGDWNTGDSNTGYFNTMTPFKIMVFNKECLKADWDRCEKPDFIYFNCVELVLESDMTEQEKIDHPEATITGGYLKTLEYKEAFQRSYNKASDEDRSKIKKLPNFDSEIFYEISGIRV